MSDPMRIPGRRLEEVPGPHVFPSPKVTKPLIQRLAFHAFETWKLQDETQERPAPTGEELERFRELAAEQIRGSEAILAWLSECRDDV